MNGLSNFDATYREYSLASTDTDDLISFPRSKVKVTAGHRGQNLWTSYLMYYLSNLDESELAENND